MRSGDDCPGCGIGVLRRYDTKTEGLRRTRYYKCDHCGQTGKGVTPIDAKGRDAFPRSANKSLECPCCGHTIQP